MQIVNVPIEYDRCYTATVSSPALTDYKFLSANSVFQLPVVSMDGFLNPSINPYFLPSQQAIFVEDLIRSGNIVEVVGSDIFIRKSDLTLSSTTFSTYFSAVSSTAPVVETHTIKSYTSNHGRQMYLDIDNGEVFDVVCPSWIETNCSNPNSVRTIGVQLTGAILSGGVAQDMSASNSNRNAYAVQNRHASLDLFLHIAGGTATPNDFKLPAGETMNLASLGAIPTGKISVYGATTGQPYVYFEG